MAKPGEAIYIDIDDINSGQTSAPTYSRGSGDSFVRSGTISGGSGGYKHSSTAEIEARKKLEEEKKQKAIEEKAIEQANAERLRLQNELARKRAASSTSQQEIYNQQLRLYAQPDRSNQYLHQTATYRPPTPQEQIKIDLATERGSISGGIKYIESKINQGIEKVRELPTVVTVRDKFQGSIFFKKIKDLEEWEKGKRDYTPTDTSKLSTSTFTTPEGVKSVFDFGAEQTLRAGEKGSSFLIDKKIVTDPLLIKPSTISREGAKEVISNLYMFSAFSPAMRTGTVQQMESKYVYDQKTGRFIKRSDLRKYLEAKKEGNTIILLGKGKGNFGAKSDKVRELMKYAKGDAGRLEVLKAAKETYGKDFVKEFVSQEGIGGYAISTTPTTIKTTTAPQVAQMKNIAFVESATTAPQRFQLFGKTENIFAQDFKQDTKQDTAQQTKQDTKQRTAQLLDFSPAQKNKLRTGKVTRQQTKQDILTGQITQQIPIPKQQPRQKTDSIFDDWVRSRPKRPEPKKPKVFKSSSLLKRLGRKVEKEPELFSVFGRRFGKDIKIGEFKTKRKAKQKLQSFLIGTLGRSGKVKKGEKDLSFEELGFGSQFRKGKRDSKRIIQKAKFSLGSRSERKEIQYFKKKSKKKRSWLFS